MPYIDTTPTNAYIKIDEDNAIEQIGQILVDNGWTFVKSFYKAVGDTRAFWKGSDRRTNYAFAQHFIYRNAEGKLLGMANVGIHSISYLIDYGEVIRRPYDDKREGDPNFGIDPTWETWALQKYADTAKNTSIYFYMLEKEPSEEYVPQGSLISCTVMPGMSGTRLDLERDRDTGYYKVGWSSGSAYRQFVELDKDDWDLEFNGKSLSASRDYMVEAALDIEVMKTTWYEKEKEVSIDYAEPRIMQSPYVEVQLRPSATEYVNNPIYYTNWWSDSEISLRGFVDSKTMNFVIQADSAPIFDGNAVPTIPIYFGKVIPINGVEADEHNPGYVLFGGTVPPQESTASLSRYGTTLRATIGKDSTRIPVNNMSKLPDVGKNAVIGTKEVVTIVSKANNMIEVIRGVGVNGKPDLEGEELAAELENVVKSWKKGTRIRATDEVIAESEITDPLYIVSVFDFDNPGAKMSDPKMPILKTYGNYPSNGVDSVMATKTRFGARYQAHYLSWGTAPNALPPEKAKGSKKYPNAYDSLENTSNYKFQFNVSNYSDKVHASPVYVVHPEDGVRGYLEYAIGFNPQSVGNSMLKVRTQSCPDREYDLYAPNVVGAVSPLTKLPATTFRPMGLGIFKEHKSDFLDSYNPKTDSIAPGVVTITKVDMSVEHTVLVEWKPPTDLDFFGVNVYVNDKLYAQNVSGINSYLVGGLLSSQEVVIKIESIDLAGNVSAQVATDKLIIL